VEDAEHQNGAAIVTVLKGVCATEHLEEDFAVFLATCEGSSHFRMPTKNLSSHDKFARDTCSEVGKSCVQERSESIEVGEGVERPLDLY
jgi:hypothetical protein